MELDLGIRLVIIFPTLLFLIGYIFKGIIEGKSMEKITEKEHWAEHRNDFFFIFGIESLFLFVANGLIIVFELQQKEIGVISIIVGIIFSICLLVGIYAISAEPGVTALIFGYGIIFGSLTGQLGYFISYGYATNATNYVFLGFIAGVLISGFVIWLALSKKKWQPQNKNNSITNSNKKEVGTKDESVILKI